MRRLRALGDAASTRVDAREALVRHSENVVKGGASLSPPRLGRYNRHVDPTRPRKRTERSIGASEKSDDDESHNVDGAALGKTLGTTDEDGLSRLQLGGGDDAQTRRKTTPRRARGEIVFRTRATKPTNHRSTRGETSRRVSRRACLRGRARCGSARRRLSRLRLVAHAAAVVTPATTTATFERRVGFVVVPTSREPEPLPSRRRYPPVVLRSVLVPRARLRVPLEHRVRVPRPRRAKKPDWILPRPPSQRKHRRAQ